MRLCIAAPNLSGPFAGSGIGWPMTGLAEAMQAAGHDVTAVMVGQSAKDATRDWEAHLLDRGIDCLTVKPDPAKGKRFGTAVGGEVSLTRSYALYELLRDRPFDLVHMPEVGGVGYIPLMARKTGAAFADTPMVVTALGPLAWRLGDQVRRPDGQVDLLTAQLERFCIAEADGLISPSDHMADWIADAGWRAADRIERVPPVPPGPPAALTVSGIRPAPPREIVFAGEAGADGGLYPFLDALLDLAERRPDLAETAQATILSAPPGGATAQRLLGKRLAGLPMPLRVVQDRTPIERRAYLTGPGRLAVFPTLRGNAPDLLTGALSDRVPLLAFSGPGVGTLIDSAEHLVAPNAAALSTAIEAALDRGLAPATPAAAFKSAADRWVRLHESLSNSRARAQASGGEVVKLSVCVTTQTDPAALRTTLASLARQSLLPAEVVVAGYGHRAEGVSAADLDTDMPFPVRFDSGDPRRDIAEARNAAARQATGPVLLFLDAGAVLTSGATAGFARATHTFDIATAGAVVAGPTAKPGTAQQTVLHAGDLGPVNRLGNLIGGPTLAITKAAFAKSGGFPDQGFDYEAWDWAFYRRAIAAGLRIGTLIEPQVWEPHTDPALYAKQRYADLDTARALAARGELRPEDRAEEPQADLARTA